VRLLFVEDNDRLAELVSTGLSKVGFAVDRFGSLGDAEEALAMARYDAVILDLGLPDGDGMDLLRRLRGRGDTTPLLILTARDGLGARVEGLNAGADDYLIKPFANEELVARVRALLRRPGGGLGMVLTFGDVSFDIVARETRVGTAALPLSRRETALMEHLMRRAGRVVPKRFLEETLYGFDEEVSANTIEATVSRLRKRLQGAGASVAVHTVRGVGYLLVVEDACTRDG
jgi:DNA-binding response OmpR family regulator